MVNVKFEDLRIFFYYQVNQARHLEILSKNFFIWNVSKWSSQIRKVIMIKAKYEDFRTFFYYQAFLAQHLRIFGSNVSKWSNSKSCHVNSKTYHDYYVLIILKEIKLNLT